MEVTLILNGLDLSNKLSTYNVAQEISYRKVITTLDNVEHAYRGVMRPIVTFSLLPLTDDEYTSLYNKVQNHVFEVTYTDRGREYTKQMRIVSNLDAQFLLMSVDGKRRWKSGAIQLRAI